MKNKPEDKAIDARIGGIVRELRLSMGLTLMELAAQIGVTHQQLYKYEKGNNRICVARLLAISKALRKSVAYFLVGLSEEVDELPTQHQRMCIEVSRSFMRIQSAAQQNAVNLLVRSLAEGA